MKEKDFRELRPDKLSPRRMPRPRSTRVTLCLFRRRGKRLGRCLELRFGNAEIVH
jgi:hypothetical protein